MKKFFMPVVSILLVMLIVCSMSLPAFATHKPLVASDEADTEDDFDEDAFVGKDALIDPSYENIPITTAPLPNITQPLQYSEEMLTAYENLCSYIVSLDSSFDISIEDFYESFCLGQYVSIEEYLSSCKEEVLKYTESNVLSNSSAPVRSNVENSYWYYNTGLTSPQKPNYSRYNLLNIVQKGDIIHESGNHTFHHAAIVEGIYYDWRYGQYYIRLIEVIGYSTGTGEGDGVCRSILDDDRFDEREGTILRLKSAYYNESKVNSAIAFCVSQIGKSYSLGVLDNSYSSSEPDWYCSQLVWAAFYNQGINIRTLDVVGIHPDEFLSSSKLETIASFTSIEETETPELRFVSVPSPTSVSLSWYGVSNATAYNVYRARSATGTYTLIHTVTPQNDVLSTTYVDNSVSSGSSYCYRISAVVGGRESNRGVVKAVKTSYATPIIMLMYSTATKVYLEWSAVYGATNHYVCRSTSENGSYMNFQATNSLNFTDTDIEIGTTYYYKVMLSNGSTNKESSVSSTVPLVINTPTIYFGIATSTNAITIKWTFSLNATSYTVYRSTSPNSGYVAYGSTTETVFTDLHGSAGTTYYYKIKAFNETEESEYSIYRSVTTLSS